MGKYTIKKNNLGFSLTKGVFSGEFNPINYIFYLAFLLSIKLFLLKFVEIEFMGLLWWGILSFWHSLFLFFTYDLWNSGFSRIMYLLFFLPSILALLPIVYRILNGNGHRNFFIFLALNLVLNILTVRWELYYGESFLNNIFWTLTLIPLFMSFNHKEIQNTDIKMSSKTKLSGNLYDDLD